MQRGEAALQDLIRELQVLNAPYTIDRFLSSGSYGAVCAGKNSITGEPAAIKRVYTTVSDGKVVNILSDTFLARRVVREVKLLCHFNHPNILGLRDLIVNYEMPSKHKMYLVTELMKTDLAQVIGDRRIELQRSHIVYYAYHMLLGLRTLHMAGVVHRDLHPGNILLSEDHDVKICDFNLAREDTQSDTKTHYVTHRWYRAPELVMQHRGFTKVVDVWSAGCVVAELFNRKALFRGSTFYNQLNKIVEVVGTPAEEDVEMFASESARAYLRNTLSNVKPVPWEAAVPTADEAARDLIGRMLTFNPNKRITVEDALRHPFFAEVFDEADLAEATAPPFHFDDSIDDVNSLHAVLGTEVQRFNEQRAAMAEQAAMGQQQPTSPRTDAPEIGRAHMPRTGSAVSFADYQ